MDNHPINEFLLRALVALLSVFGAFFVIFISMLFNLPTWFLISTFAGLMILAQVAIFGKIDRKYEKFAMQISLSICSLSLLGLIIQLILLL